MVASRRVGAIFLRVAAAVGVTLAGLYWGIALIGGGWCWVQLSYLILFVSASGALLLLGKWEGIAAGATCWIFLILLCDSFVVRTGLAERLAFPVLVMGLAAVLVGLIGVSARWVWRLPLPRSGLAIGLCSLLMGASFLLHPYWVARFHGARADLRGALLTMTDLRRAGLRGADLWHARLRFACLDGADLEGANLAGADLRDTCLDGAYLSGADLTGAKLTNALFSSETTRWPAHFNPSAHGAVERVWL